MTRHHLRTALPVLLLALALLAPGCAKKPQLPARIVPPQKYADIADLRDLPQDTRAYLEPGKADVPVMSELAAQMKTLAFFDKFFAPWKRKRPAYTKKSVASPFRAYKKSPGWDEDNRPRDPGWAAELENNADLARFPSKTRRAVTVANSNLRSLPTRGARYNDPAKPGEGHPFDYVQHSAVWINTPLLVTHETRDGAWALAESPYTYGWLPAKEIAYVDDAFVREFQAGSYAALLRDNTRIPGSHRLTAGIGALFPVQDVRDGAYEALYAARGPGGNAVLHGTRLPRGRAALLPLSPTPRNIAEVGNDMMGQHYGWAGLDGLRDCSAMTRDLFAPFGVWLPRNSTAQAKSHPMLSLEGLSPAQKEQKILERGVPFATLIWLKGHIMLYVGRRDGRPLVFHNVWGLRTLEPDGSTGRRVIGKAVVTSLRAGEELPEVGQGKIWINRVRAMTFLAGPN